MVILPKTTLGKWSLGLIILMPMSFVIGMTFMSFFYSSAPVGNTILEDLGSRPALAIPMLLGMASGVASFVTGFWSIFKKQERSLLVYVSTLIGAILIFFLVGEFMSPH